LEEEEEV
jgi:flagellar basal body-associated protein FliL